MTFEFPAGPTATGVVGWDKRAGLYRASTVPAHPWEGEERVKSRRDVNGVRGRVGSGQGSSGARRERRTRTCVWRRFTAERGGCVAGRTSGSCEPGRAR